MLSGIGLSGSDRDERVSNLLDISRGNAHTVIYFNKLLNYIQVGNDQEMGQSERNSHSINRGVGKTKMTLRYLYQETYRKPSEQLFPDRRPLSHPN